MQVSSYNKITERLASRFSTSTCLRGHPQIWLLWPTHGMIEINKSLRYVDAYGQQERGGSKKISISMRTSYINGPRNCASLLYCFADRLSATTATNCLEGYVLPWGHPPPVYTLRTEAFSSTNTNSRPRGPCPSQAHRLESCTLSWWADLHINRIQETPDVKGTVIQAHLNFWGVPYSVNRVAITKWLTKSVTLQTRKKQFVI